MIDYYEKNRRGDRFLQRLRDNGRAEKLLSLPFHNENRYESVGNKRYRTAA